MPLFSLRASNARRERAGGFRFLSGTAPVPKQQAKADHADQQR